jgi:hypothetical protein
MPAEQWWRLVARAKKRWYAAHILMAVKRMSSRQRMFPIFENIVIFHAATPDDVRMLAKEHAHREYEGDASLTLNGHRARMVFVGVRKVVECQESTERALKYPKKRGHPPSDGTEVTYSAFSVVGKAALLALATGQRVSVVVDELAR